MSHPSNALNLIDPEDHQIPLKLLKLALPIILSMMSRTAMNFIDFIMVTQLGTEAQAAIMPSAMVLFCVLAGAMGLLSAVSTFVAQSLGRGKPGECSAYAWQGVHLSIIVGVLLLPMWWLMPPLFEWAGHDPAVRQMEIDYAQIGVLGFIPAMAAIALTNFFNGIHRPMVALVAMIIANLFNIVGNYALIFGHWGFPAMGVAGAAWSTQASGLVQVLIMLGWLAMPYYRHHYQALRTWAPDLRRMGRLLWIGTPAAMHFMVEIVAWTVFTVVLVGQFGTVQLAAHNVTFKCLELSFMPTVGLGIALTAAVGKAIGAKRPDRARRIVRWGAIYGVSYMGLIALVYVSLFTLSRVAGPEALQSWLTQDVEVIAWTTTLLLFCAVFQLFDAMTIIYVHALRGAGDTHGPAAISIVMAIAVCLGGGFAMAHWLPQWGSAGPWLAATVYICLLGVAYALRWRWGAWERIDLHQGVPPVDDPAIAAAESQPLP